MKHPWFRKVGWIYLPTSWQGAIVAVAFLAFCVHIFLFVDGKSHSVSDTLYGIFPFIVPAFLMYVWIGSETNK
jgi:hypothetical protein